MKEEREKISLPSIRWGKNKKNDGRGGGSDIESGRRSKGEGGFGQLFLREGRLPRLDPPQRTKKRQSMRIGGTRTNTREERRRFGNLRGKGTRLLIPVISVKIL